MGDVDTITILFCDLVERQVVRTKISYGKTGHDKSHFVLTIAFGLRVIDID